jgi:2-amino-4-hydroxy-6-hydroxymethyldihydropteridine diphosphokinase
MATFEAALAEMAKFGKIEAVSQLYETDPVGGPVQPDFFNAAVCLRTPLVPQRLLEEILIVERNHGRIRDSRWGPRSLDLDILWIEGISVDLPGLRVPHARLVERSFALVPLLDVVPNAIDPNTGKAYRDIPIDAVRDGVRLCGRLGGAADAFLGQHPLVPLWHLRD